MGRIDNHIICDLKNYDILEKEDYKKPGVWAMYGKDKSSLKEWECLQVATTKEIASEIKSDIGFILNPQKPILETKPYFNQFAEKCFDYEEYSSARYQLYQHISENYSDIIFVCVCLEEDGRKRRKKESEFAWLSHAKYWRNGGAFENKRENYYDQVFNESDISSEIKECNKNIKQQLNNCSVVKTL